METESSRSEERRTPGRHQQDASSPPIPPRKVRVRTGCLVCRARKVKCDEQRPACQKCIRLKKKCAYRTSCQWETSLKPPLRTRTTEPSAEGLARDVQPQTGRALHQSTANTADSGSGGSGSQIESADFPSMPDRIEQADSRHDLAGCFVDPFPQESAEMREITGDVPSQRFQKASQLIYLSTIVDWIAACEAPTPSSFCYFTEVVDCPLLAPFDHLNWTRVKHYIAHLGMQEIRVAESLLAIQALYRAQVDRLPMTHAMSVYEAAITSFQSMVGDYDVDFDSILASAFILCLCAVTLPNEDGSHFSAINGAFEKILHNWLTGSYRSPISLRICAWLQILNTTTKHPGSAGLLSEAMLDLLNAHVHDVPSLAYFDSQSHPERGLYDTIATPVFTFYLQLQKLSNQVTDLTHYRRSRTTPRDQEEVTNLLSSIERDLSLLWNSRPAPLHLRPDQIREQLGADISDRLVAVAGLCIAAFHTETVVIGRIRGDSSFPSVELKYALDQIKTVIQSDWNTSVDGSLNPGYVRPIFVYALESPQKSEAEWAAEKLRQVKNPISRSNYLASFVEAHGEAQRSQARRVTMKYFSYQTFGVPLPYM